jgi:uncharacterized membrane protein
MRNFGYSPMYYHSSFWPEGVIALIINILIWGLIIYLVMHIVRKISGGHGGCCGMRGGYDQSEDMDDSIYLDIVKRRYAKGEINKKEYDELKKDFSGEQSEAVETAKE